MIDWIPISKREWPDPGKEVLVTIGSGDGAFTTTMLWTGRSWEQSWNRRHIHDPRVTAWAALPEPYQPKEEK